MKYRLIPMHNTHIKNMSKNYNVSWVCLIQDSKSIDELNNRLNRDDITSAYFTTDTGDYDDIYISFEYPSFAFNKRYFKVMFY